MPKVSVIVPVHNAEKYLGECLDSILGQTLRDIEVLCVDDGSTDGSEKILVDYAARDARVKVFRTEHVGAAVARNRGLSEVTGEYLFFCDADDWIDQRALGSMWKSAKNTGADVAITGMWYFDDATRTEFNEWRPDRAALALPRPFAPTDVGVRLFLALRAQMGGKMFRTGFVRGLGLEFQDQPRVNDLSFVAVALAASERILADGSRHYHYRKNHGGNLCSGINEHPEMSALAWLRAKEVLEGRGVFERFRAAFALAASQSLVDVVSTMSDPPAAERFFRRVREELILALGLDRDSSVPAARPFFESDSPLPICMERLAAMRRRQFELKAKLLELRRHPFRAFWGFIRRRFA